MHISKETLDDALYTIFQRLLRSKNRIKASKGEAKEIVGALITIKDPRARFSRTENRATLFSCLGETLWYLSGSNRLDMVEHYIPKYRERISLPIDAETTRGAYGPRLFGYNGQIPRIIDLLKSKRSDTRQAVVQIFDASDLENSNTDVPCTCTLQFLPRQGKLHMYVSMRSNDAYLGLPHDVFAFTLIQELVARSVALEIGLYHHAVGSLHLYNEHFERAQKYIGEGLQDKAAMPPMPMHDPWSSVKCLLDVESSLRIHGILPSGDEQNYWADFERLLKIRELLARGDLRGIVRERRALSPIYWSFVRDRVRKSIAPPQKSQPLLPGMEMIEDDE